MQPQLPLLMSIPCTQDVCGQGCTPACVQLVHPLNLLPFNLLLDVLITTPPQGFHRWKETWIVCLQVKSETTKYKVFDHGICVGNETEVNHVYGKPQWKERLNKQVETTASQPANVSDGATLPSESLSCRLRLGCRLPPSSYHWLATDLDALLPSSSEMTLCAQGVILEDNIVPKHSLKVDPKRKGPTASLSLRGC